ncbi:hypothetical protein BGZ98_004643 [Dissophora globulifera]|nr:hypothetical protein BGZ98_004643 [Dissophora globulifera]
MPAIRVLSFDHVAAILDGININDVLTSQAKAFHAYSANKTQTPQRETLITPYHRTLIMPARIDTLTSVIKVVSIPHKDSKDGLPGVTIVLDNETGEPRGLVNARLLTPIRTAAASALATRAIFTAKESQRALPERLTLVVFGSGAQAKAHIQLLIHILPQMRNVIICNRTLPRAQALVDDLQGRYTNTNKSDNEKLNIVAFSMTTGESTGPIYAGSTSSMMSSTSSPQKPTQDPIQAQLRDIVQSADVICTCTNSRQALFPGEWVKPGTHLNMVGSYTPEMHEVDQSLVQRAFTLADAHRECEEEAGEFILAKSQTGDNGILTELGLIHDQDGRLDLASLPKEFSVAALSSSTVKGNKDVTIFKSVGIAAQDVAITAQVLERAEALNLGSCDI